MLRTTLTVVLLVGILGSTTALAQTASDDTPASAPDASLTSPPDAPVTSEQAEKLQSMLDAVGDVPSVDPKVLQYSTELENWAAGSSRGRRRCLRSTASSYSRNGHCGINVGSDAIRDLCAWGRLVFGELTGWRSGCSRTRALVCGAQSSSNSHDSVRV